MMEFHWKEFVVQVFNFLVLFFLLRKFLWKRFLSAIDARREKIAHEFKTIEDTKAETARLQEEYQQKLKQIEETARQRIQSAVADGQRIAQEIREGARQEADRTINSAQEEIRFELKQAKEELKGLVVDLTIRATEGMIKEKLNPDVDQKLVEGLLREMEQPR